MERGSLVRWLLIGVGVFLFIQFVWPAITGKDEGGESQLQPLAGIIDNTAPPEAERQPEVTCTIDGNRFKAELSNKGGVLKHVWMKDAKYTQSVEDNADPIDLVTTTVQSRMSLRTDLREPSGSAEQVPYNDLDWSLGTMTAKACTFTYEDDKAKLEKVISANDRPFELEVSLSVTNKADAPQKHRLTIEQTDWRTKNETVGGFLQRAPEFMTRVETHAGGETERLDPTDFEPSEFSGENGFTAEMWRRIPGDPSWTAVASSYFAKAIVPIKGPDKPAAEMLIEQWWDQAKFPNKDNDPNYGHLYRARLAYPVKELGTGETAAYEMLAYVGPKERAILSSVGGTGHEAIELLDLGWFGWIGRILIHYLYLLYGLVGTWGIAICLLTITVKILLFPLSITQIKSTMAMRKLKPEMDEINAKYKDDATQRGLAMQELWRKNKVTNPMLGCLPILLQMPVWFALYQALQTAVELYHTPFGPLIPDLSAPDGLYIIPVLLGASSFLQQHLMPMQGDAMQQKMMKYMMPGMFTVMMLFLPAGLGIYFLTNTWLSILQQVAVERFYKSRENSGGGGGQTKSDDKSDKKADKADAKPA